MFVEFRARHCRFIFPAGANRSDHSFLRIFICQDRMSDEAQKKNANQLAAYNFYVGSTPLFIIPLLDRDRENRVGARNPARRYFK